MSNRRRFLQKLAGIGAAVPFIRPSSFTRIVKGNVPVVMCSRGETWGRKVLEPAWNTLRRSGNILDAVEAGANVVELDPEDTSVGYGGLPNERGIVSLDASIMYGPTHNCGSVAGLENIKKACSVARLVMERTDHVLIVGQGALDFARAHGFPEENLLTDKSRRIWLRWKENHSEHDDWFPPADGDYKLDKRPRGTINVLGIGEEGDIAGITTTSGLFAKIPGRVGDSPIIGAGLYVDNNIGAAGATGRGEEVIKTCGSFLVVEYMRQGMSPQEACEAVCRRIVEINGGLEHVDFNDKFVAINKDGEVGVSAILGSKEGPPKAAFICEEGFTVVEGSWLKSG